MLATLGLVELLAQELLLSPLVHLLFLILMHMGLIVDHLRCFPLHDVLIEFLQALGHFRVLLDRLVRDQGSHFDQEVHLVAHETDL